MCVRLPAMKSSTATPAPSMARHTGPAYWQGGPAETSERTPGEFWDARTARRCACQMRELADAMPDDAPDAARRRACLRERADQIDAGQYNPAHHFRVFVPYYRETPKGRRVLRELSYPCRGRLLYTFDEAWLLMEAFAAKRGWEDCHPLDTRAEGRGQNMALSYIYDGIAEPCREVSPGHDREVPY